MRRIKTTNPELINLIRFLKKRAQEDDAKIWRAVADRLSKPRQRRAAVNLSRLNRHTQGSETVVVPGKVLGAGIVDHPIYIAAFAFSNKAKSKISKAKGKCLTFEELMKKNPKGMKVKIIG